MLVATEVAKDVVMWHLLFNPAGERISFCDERIQGLDDSAIKDVSLGALGSRQHIVGWCGSIQEYTGKFSKYFTRTNFLSSLPSQAFQGRFADIKVQVIHMQTGPSCHRASQDRLNRLSSRRFTPREDPTSSVV